MGKPSFLVVPSMRKTLKKVLANYDNSAQFYDMLNSLYFFGRDKIFRSMLAKKTNLKSGDLVLDLCCGTGLDFPFVLEKIGRQGMLLGLDVSSNMLLQSKDRRLEGNVNLIRSDAAYLPFRDNSLNVYLASFCLKITPALEFVVNEAARVLKYDGRIGVLTNSRPTFRLRIIGNVITWLISLFSLVDFEIDLDCYLSERFEVLLDKKMHMGFVQLLIGKIKKLTILNKI